MGTPILTLLPQLEPYRGLIQFLLADLQGWANIVKEDSEFSRRLTIKTIFTAIEGIVNLVKQFLLDQFSERFTPEEILVLKEVNIQINEKGSVDEKDYYPRVQHNLLFTLKMMQKGMDNQHDVDRQSPFWKRFLGFVELRHKLTHPKVESATDVSSKDIHEFGWTIFWLVDNFVNVVCVAKGKDTLPGRVLAASWHIIANAFLIRQDAIAAAVIMQSDELKNEPDSKQILTDYQEGKEEIAKAVKELENCFIEYPEEAKGLPQMIEILTNFQTLMFKAPEPA